MLVIFWILTLMFITSAQEQRFFFGAPQQDQFVQGLSSPESNYYIQNPSNFNQQDFLESDLQTSDLPPHLQQTLPQYQFSRFNQPAVQPPTPFQLPSRQNNANTYLFHDDILPKAADQQIPKPQPLNISPKRAPAKTPHSHFLTHSSHNHDPSQTETFLGQITLQNADTPVDFNRDPAAFRPSREFAFHHSSSLVDQFPQVEDRWHKTPNVPVKPINPSRPRIHNKPFRQLSESVDQNLEGYTDRENQNRNELQLRRFKPSGSIVDRPFTNSVQIESGNQFSSHYSRPAKPKTRNNFVINNNGEIFTTTRNGFRPKPTTSTQPSTTLGRRNRFHPSTKAPSKPLTFHLKSNKTPFAPKKTTTSTTTENSVDLESLLEERTNENEQHSIYEDDVEVVQSDSESTTLLTTELQHEELTTELQDENLTTELHDENLTRELHDENLTTEFHDENLTTELHDENLTTELQEENVTTEAQDENLTTELQEKQQTTELQEQQQTTELQDNKLATTTKEEHLDNTTKPDDVTTMEVQETETNISVRETQTVATLVSEENSTPVPTAAVENIDYTDSVHYDYYDDEYEDLENKTTTVIPADKFSMTSQESKMTNISNEEVSANTDLHSSEQSTGSPFTTMSESEFDVLTLKPSPKTVEDDNFHGFIDSVLIDYSTEEPVNQTLLESTNESINLTSTLKYNNEPAAPSTTTTTTESITLTEIPVKEEPVLIGEAVVSVVTTKSVINGTVSLPVTAMPDVTVQMNSPEKSKETASENWMVIASVQTSRSVSGARYLAFPNTGEDDPMQSLHQDEQNINSQNSKTAPDGSDLLVDISSSTQSSSTESISDKLDRVQSELSSGFLSGGFRNAINNIAIITEPVKTAESSTTTSTTTTTTTTTTQKPTTTPIPVIIRKFSANLRPSTTHRPRKTYIPDISASHRPVPIIPKSPPQTHSDLDIPQSDEPENKNSGNYSERGFFNNNTFKNKIAIKDDISAFLPPGFKEPKNVPKETNKTQTDKNLAAKDNGSKLLSKIFENVGEIDSQLLPANYKPPTPSTTTAKSINIEDLLSKSVKLDNNAFLPPGYKPIKEKTTTEKVDNKPAVTEAPVKNTTNTKVPNISFNVPASLLPPGYKLSTSENETQTTPKSKLVTEVFALPDNLLPPGYKQKFSNRKPITTTTSTEVPSTTTSAVSSTTAAGPIKIVFPSRPGGRKPISRATTPRSSNVENAAPTGPVIQKGWPTRATTEFTGWPTPSTTPISIEKLLEAARLATASSLSTETYSSTSSTTTTTTTTTTTPAPTTPGVCRADCDLAATIKLVGGVQWVPELLHHNTKEWQILANEVQIQLEKVYNSSTPLSKWYKKIKIEEFSKGSVLVDYYVELSDLGRKIDTVELKSLFNEALTTAPTTEARSISENDRNKQNNKNNSRLMLGKFVIDSEYTDFIVIPKQAIPTVDYADNDVFLPQWAIAVIVIGLASLLFVVIFGVTVLVNRQKNAKKKQPIPLSEEMLNELNKNHMGGLDNYGADDLYNMEDVWNDKGYETKLPKQKSTSSLHDNSMSNLYDSWKSEWNGYYYNNYYNNAGSSNNGYTRRRSDYDTNF